LAHFTTKILDPEEQIRQLTKLKNDVTTTVETNNIRISGIQQQIQEINDEIKQLENDIVQNQYSYSEAEKLQKAQKIIELKSDLQRAQKTLNLINPNNENLKNNITMINSKIQEIETNRITKMENDIMTKIGDTDPTPALKKNIEYIMKQIEKDNKIIEMLNNGNKAINPDVGTAEDILKQTLGNGTAGAPPVY
jgi:chromosome segregation ATPase